MAKKITIQHWYTTGTTAAPAASALTLGEIAISAGKDKEGIYFKNNNNEVVNVLTSAQTRSMILDTAGSVEGFNDHIAYKANNREHSNNNNAYGHVRLISGELSGYTSYGNYMDGEAAAAQHTHGQYYSFLDSGKGLTTIIGSEENGHPGEKGFAISDNTYAQITGATQTTTFNAHTGNTTVHITGEERTNWNNASSAITAFLDSNAAISGAVDTLREINEYLTGTGTSVETLLETLDDLTNTVDSNTTAITQNSNNISNLIISATTNANNIKTLGQTIGQVSTNVTTINNTIGTGFTPQNTITSEIESIKSAQSNFVTSISGDNKNLLIFNDATNRYTIAHTSASTQNSAITATNNPTGLSFGSEFKIVNNIGYDANGHVVSGTTQTLKLPTIQTATTINYGIVKLKSGELTLEDELLKNEDYSRTAAGVAHGHTEYVKFTDLYSGNTSSNITISCGTY